MQAHASLSVPGVFSDHMVVQRQRPIPVWGRADSNAEVAVTLAGQSRTAKADAAGAWKVAFDPVATPGPHTLEIRAGNESLRITDVLVGEVWLCSGQSNMQMRVEETENGPEEAQTAAQYKDLRLLLVPKNPAQTPQAKVDAKWSLSTPEAAADFSATAFFFAREIKQSPALKDVPVGLIDSSFGGTVVEAWMRKEYLAEHFPDEKLSDSMFGFKPSSMFNGLIAPLIPYSIRGVLWYQGESNSPDPQQYARLFPGLIAHWREEWQQPDLPFLFVQLPNHAEKFIGRYFTGIREAQQQTANTVPHTAMAVTIDTGDGYDVHPINKKDVGQRLGLLARATIYGDKIPCRGPQYESHTIEGDTARVKFRAIEGGLVNGNTDGPLLGFALAGDDGFFRYAKATIEGDSVVLRNPQVPAPRHIRYAWEGDPRADLYNTAGLPAAPFRTDTLSGQEFEIFEVPVSRSVSTDLYEALVDGNGMLVSLRVKGVEFLPATAQGVPGSHFVGFFGAQPLTHVTPLGPHLLRAEMGDISIVYEFHEESMVWTLGNRGKDNLTFRIVFANPVDACAIGDGEFQPLPINATAPKTTWRRDNATLTIEAPATQRFPFDKFRDLQTWETVVKSGQELPVRLTMKAAATPDAAKPDAPK